MTPIPTPVKSVSSLVSDVPQEMFVLVVILPSNLLILMVNVSVLMELTVTE